MDCKTVQSKLRAQADQSVAEHSRRFFKTGPGEYGEGDRFLGLRVPLQRKIARSHQTLPMEETERLLQSEFHEERLTALFILVYKFEKGGNQKREAIYRCYLRNLEQVNNWDLVDSSAPKIMGPYLEQRDRSILYRLAKSNNLWRRRIAMISCMHFIRKGDFEDALNIARILRDDTHDLIQKAVGWMLREIGHIDIKVEEQFLKENRYRELPRTLLRYAIEKFPEEKRQAYLSGNM
ncbi:DNA alkylation repair protein [Halalkalibaculum sp. DA3122]|uniref:DNA alkylation repair protein n=1 Tax=Halalkalibaculum sp. DA3122 TaxID=3373607 RepID=UPI00375466BB